MVFDGLQSANFCVRATEYSMKAFPYDTTLVDNEGTYLGIGEYIRGTCPGQFQAT